MKGKKQDVGKEASLGVPLAEARRRIARQLSEETRPDARELLATALRHVVSAETSVYAFGGEF